jgi:hypothetical protein
MNMRSKKIRFEVVERTDRKDLFIDDDDFGYDAMIIIEGDFGYAEKLAYAQAVVDALNTAGDKIPVSSRNA